MKYSPSFLVFLLLFVNAIILTDEQPLVPALFLFGDSLVDIGNNNNRYTFMKCDYPPYGMDFEKHIPTGRFCNGKLITDYFVDALGFTSYPPAYLSLQVKGKNLLNGANFASAGSGYLDSTADLYNVISLTQQLEYYKECQNVLMKTVGQSNALSIISRAIHGVSTGSNDFIMNYFQYPLHWISYTPDQFTDLLIQHIYEFIQSLYALGARKIGVINLSSIGCLPIAITLFGSNKTGCVTRINNLVINFNKKLKSTSQTLQTLHPDLNLVYLDSYQPLYDLVSKPSKYGFSETTKACCGTGTVEVSILCNQKSVITCANTSKYVFWDSFHPSEAANKFISVSLLNSATGLILS